MTIFPVKKDLESAKLLCNSLRADVGVVRNQSQQDAMTKQFNDNYEQCYGPRSKAYWYYWQLFI